MEIALVVEIFAENESLDVREGVNDKGKPWKMITQIGYAYTGGKFPVEMKIKLSEGTPAYKAGKYYLAPSSFVVSAFGDLGIGRETLLLPYDGKGKAF
ncbi:single-stranded DNA-binding protein [Vibrio nigripulchritudo]|uniref:single-stranded DNA-binding protein n=1 Tax=Vibrio nigripulchritudo TaxID=28173 RepID=UPI00066C7D79|nr:single-stranded DNA-binding protein [Vibrio nigripulchritudo]